MRKETVTYIETIKDLLYLITTGAIPEHRLIYEPHTDGTACYSIEGAPGYKIDENKFGEDNDEVLRQVFAAAGITVHVT